MPRKRAHDRKERVADTVPPLTASLVFVDRERYGLRQVDTLASILQVRAAPWAARDRLRSWRPLGFMVYIIDIDIDGPEIYTGHGRGNRQIGDRLDQAQCRAAKEVYAIHSLDDRFDKHRAIYLESRLVEIGDDLGVRLANQVRPLGYGGLFPSAQDEHLVQDAQFLLWVAGFTRFEDARAGGTVSRCRLAATSVLDDAEFVAPEEFAVPADAVMRRLACGFNVTGFAGADGRFYVLPGSDWPWENRPGLSHGDIRRRETVVDMGLIDPVPGSTEHGRLRPGVRCRSAAAAAALVSGKPLRAVAWKPVVGPADGQ